MKRGIYINNFYKYNKDELSIKWAFGRKKTARKRKGLQRKDTERETDSKSKTDRDKEERDTLHNIHPWDYRRIIIVTDFVFFVPFMVIISDGNSKIGAHVSIFSELSDPDNVLQGRI